MKYSTAVQVQYNLDIAHHTDVGSDKRNPVISKSPVLRYFMMCDDSVIKLGYIHTILHYIGGPE